MFEHDCRACKTNRPNQKPNKATDDFDLHCDPCRQKTFAPILERHLKEMDASHARPQKVCLSCGFKEPPYIQGLAEPVHWLCPDCTQAMKWLKENLDRVQDVVSKVRGED